MALLRLLLHAPYLPASGLGDSFFLPKRPKKGILCLLLRVKKKRENFFNSSSFLISSRSIPAVEKRSDEEQKQGNQTFTRAKGEKAEERFFPR